MQEESRQVRRARERAEAKAKRAEEKAKNRPEPKLKPATVEGYTPDAGMNWHPDGHGWFQVAELIQTLARQPRCRSYEWQGVEYGELNILVDIMNLEGKEHLMPDQQDGYYGTFRFTADTMMQLADQIDKGAMSVRITGKVGTDAVQTTPQGEKFRIIDVEKTWSAGNDNGFMHYTVITDKGFLSTNSREFADKLRGYANTLQQRAA